MEEGRPNKGAAPPPAAPPPPDLLNWRMPKRPNSWTKTTRGQRPWSHTETEQEQRPQLTTVLFVECTHGGEYAARLMKAEAGLAQITNYRVKIAEKAGATLRSILIRPLGWWQIWERKLPPM